MSATRCYECADERTPLCRSCLRRWLDRKPEPGPWCDIEPPVAVVARASDGSYGWVMLLVDGPGRPLAARQTNEDTQDQAETGSDAPNVLERQP